MDERRQQILDTLEQMRADNLQRLQRLEDRVFLTDYPQLAREGNVDGQPVLFWGEALQTALDEHETVVIPAREEPYYIERQIVIGSGRRILADGAIIRQTPDCILVMLRNASAADGTHRPIAGLARNHDIAIQGGRWEESRSIRMGYGQCGRFDPERSLHGVSALFFFNNLDRLTLTGLTFAHTADFSVQCGDLSCGVFEHIRFDSCYADGLHLNGNISRLLCRDIAGQVGDDLVALNLYDWQDSSVDYGPMDTVLCEDLVLSETSPYKAMRIEPGVYRYDDGSKVDCALTNAIIRRVQGILTFKMYLQTPGYRLNAEPEWGEVGSMDNVWFEDIDVDLNCPLDDFADYQNSDPVRGAFAAFEVGANVGTLVLDNIRLTLHRERYPLTYLLCCGPKSILLGDYEVFDPYLSASVEKLVLRCITVNGQPCTDPGLLVHETVFEDVNRDGRSTGAGVVKQVCFD